MNNKFKIENLIEKTVKFILKNGVIILASFLLVMGIIITISVYSSSIRKSDEKLLADIEGIITSYRAIYYGNESADTTALIVQATDKLNNIEKNAKTKNLKLRASFALAGVYFDINNYAEALKYYKQVSDSRGFYLADIAMYNMAQVYVEQAQYDDAIKTLENLIKAYPKSYLIPQANLTLSDVYIAKNDRTKAATVLKSWLTQNAENNDNPYFNIMTEALALIESNIY